MLIMAPKKNIWTLALYLSIAALCSLTIGGLDAALTCASLAGSNSTTFPIPVVPNGMTKHYRSFKQIFLIINLRSGLVI
jgi:hypothetical protein